MIDALLGEEEGEEGKEEMEMLHCSLDSIDRLGDSLTLSSSLLEQFEKERWKAGPLLKVAAIYLSLDNRAEPGLFTTSHSCKSVSTITACHSITPF